MHPNRLRDGWELSAINDCFSAGARLINKGDKGYVEALRSANLALRGIMEAAIVVALAYWGCRTGHSTIQRVVLGIGAPMLAFSFWSLIDFRNVVRAELFRCVQELILSGMAAVALYAAGQPILGWLLGFISIIHHVAVYLLGERLLK